MNMKLSKIVIACVFALMLLQCAEKKNDLENEPAMTKSKNNSEYISEEEGTKIKKEIEEILDEYERAYNRHDLDWFHKFWSNEKEFAHVGDGRVLTNYDTAVTQTYKNGFLVYKKISNKRSNEHAYILSRNAVSYAVTIDCAALNENGVTTRSRNSLLYVFKKAEGKWRVVQAAGSPTN